MATSGKWPLVVRIIVWAVAVLLVLVLAAGVISYAASGPLRDYLQEAANRQLKGYTLVIGKARFHPVNFSLDLYDVKVIQEAKKDQPIAVIPHLGASVHWSQLLWLRVVGDLTMDQPKIHFDLNNVRQEQKSGVPVEKQGWQEAVRAIYPLKIDRFTVNQGEITYIDQGPGEPLRVSGIDLLARNIRNIRSPEDAYPSDIHLDCVVLDSGRLTVDGKANFLAQPHATVKAEIVLSKLALGYFKPIAARYNLEVEKGVLSARGQVEYAIAKQVYQLKELSLDGVRLDYVHKAATAQAEERVAKKTVRAAEKASDDPDITIQIDKVRVNGSTFGFVNQATEPAYRVHLDDAAISLDRFSTHFMQGEGHLKVTGKFMGTGPAKVEGVFRPEDQGPDFDLKVAIEQTRMKPMSDIFRAYGDFSIESGLFSFYSELTIKDGRIEGYVKPLFKDLEVTDNRTPEEKSIFHDLYVGIVGAVSELLENPRQEVATVTRISGPLESPDMSTWETILNLLQNAFFKSILHGFGQSLPPGERPDPGQPAVGQQAPQQ